VEEALIMKTAYINPSCKDQPKIVKRIGRGTGSGKGEGLQQEVIKELKF